MLKIFCKYKTDNNYMLGHTNLIIPQISFAKFDAFKDI